MKKITQSAYLKELQNWAKHLKTELSKLSHKNSRQQDPDQQQMAESLKIDLEAELLRYQREQQRLRQNPGDCELSLQHYEMYARRYYFLIKEIQKAQENVVERAEYRRNSGWSTSSRQKQKRGYLNQTYCSKKATQPKKDPKKTRTLSKFAQEIEPEWISGLIKRYSVQKTAYRGHRQTFQQPDQQRQPFRHGEMRELSNQLLQLRRLMKDLQEQVQSHSHQDYEAQISGLRETNRKLTAELTILREQNNSILSIVQAEEVKRSRKR